MPIQTIPLPPWPHETAFVDLVSILKRDPMLGRFVKTWKYWAGTPTDGDAPAPETCPWIRLTPIAQGSSRFDNESHEMPWSLVIEIAVAGSQLSALDRFSGAIQSCLFTSDPTADAALWAELQKNGISNLEVTQPATSIPYNPGAMSPPAQLDFSMLWAQGRVSVLQYVKTQPFP